jgi:transcriptional regulator GlxA family with amidase domain
LRNLLFVVLPEVVLLDVAGAAEAFRIADMVQPGSYRLQFVGPTPAVRSAVGLEVQSLRPMPERIPDDAIVMIAGISTPALKTEAAAVSRVADWLRTSMQSSSATLMCVCAGSLVAAEAGLLAGRECTTHHGHIERLMQMEPTATVHANRIFVEDGNVYTSAGVTSGTDLALYMIGQQLGFQVAAAVARDLVVYMRRSGSDPQLSPWVMYRNHLHPAVHRVQDAVARNPAGDWSSERLAAVACMSARNLARLFSEHAGCSPLDYVQRLRVALAREMVVNSDWALERIAERSGFSSAHQLRRVWRRWESTPPASYRTAVVNR